MFARLNCLLKYVNSNMFIECLLYARYCDKKYAIFRIENRTDMTPYFMELVGGKG